MQSQLELRVSPIFCMTSAAGDPELRQHCSFARVNIDRVKPMVRQLGITKIPTVLLLGPDGATLASFRASGQAARDAVMQEVAAMQQQQPPPLLPPVLPPGPDDQPAPSEVEDGSNGNGSSSNGSNGSGSNGSNSSSNSSNGSGSNGSNSGDTSSAGGAATCGVTPEPSCGSLPPGVAPPGSTRSVVPSTDANPTLSPSTDPQPVTPQPPPAAAGSAVQSPPPDSSSTVMPVDEALLAAKQQFMQQYGSGYGYGGWLDKHYQQEIGARLGPNRHYLDYTGAVLLTSTIRTRAWCRWAALLPSFVLPFPVWIVNMWWFGGLSTFGAVYSSAANHDPFHQCCCTSTLYTWIP